MCDECWFELKQGELFHVDNPLDIEPGFLLPWSVQERITDIALFKDTLYFSVNGYGILTCSASKAGQAGFKPYYNHHYFEHKTMTMILPVCNPVRGQADIDPASGQNSHIDDYILCHLYFNVMVYPFKPDDTLFNGANIVKLTNPADELVIEELYPVTPEEAPYWEIVGFLPVNNDTVHLEWKNSQNTFTEFRYSRYSVKEGKEEEESREDFSNAYNFSPLVDGKTPEALRLLCEKIMAQSSQRLDYTTFHFYVDEKISHIVRYYIKEALVPITDENFEIVTIRMFEDELGYYALAQPDFVYSIKKDDMKIRQIDLPRLPKGFHYTGFFVHDNTLILSWEESAFMNVGGAGLLFFRDDLLS